MKKEIERPSHNEYVQFVESEFSFLEKQYGFTKEWDSVDDFRVSYASPNLSVHIWGWGYGESGHLSLNIGNEELPYHKYVTSLKTKLTETTGKRQLDDLREHAYRLKNECHEILRGNLSCLVPYRPFPNAEELWWKKEYSTLVTLLEKTDQPLSQEWKNRYAYALKNA